MARTRILLFLTSLILVPIGTYAAILFARGYRPNFQARTIEPTGLLRATSLPEGAQVYVNGQLKTATDNTLTLPPETYTVEIKKAGFSPWKKQLAIEAEVVTRASATLFPSVSSLKAITSSGASLPTLSPDGTKVAFFQTATASANIYVLDLSESPLGLLNRDPRPVGNIENLKLKIGNLIWSPDSKQILVQATPSAYLADLSTQQFKPTLNSTAILSDWQKLQTTRDAQKSALLPEKLRGLLASSAANLVWSPKENRLLYTATASATIPDNLIRPLPGSSTQLQSRTLVEGQTYVYDLEEDRNFQVPSGTFWFSDSSHLVKVEKNKITILEHDSANATIVYAGPMENSFVFPYPSGSQLLILTNLNQNTSPFPNLYAVSLR